MVEAPHRLAFAAAALLLSLSSLWWAIVNIASGTGVAVVRWSLPPSVGHSVLMTFGFMPLFFAGFVFTAGPKWLSLHGVSAKKLIWPTAAQLVGWFLFAVSLHGSDFAKCQLLAASGVALATVGWSGIAVRLLTMLRRSKASDKVHLTLVAIASVLGVAGLGVIAICLFTGNLLLVRATVHASLWWFVGLTFATMSHRMIPFFSGAAVPALDAWLPLWLLACFTGLFFVQGAAAFVEIQQWTEATSWRYGHGAFELLSGVGLLALARRWAAVQTLRIRLLAMLHVGFTWLGVALLLGGVARFADSSTNALSGLPLAATHAYAMGFLGSTMLAMVTRLSSGRTVAADDFIWRLFGVLQLAVLVRVFAGLPAAYSAASATSLIAAAATLWAGTCIAWTVRCIAWYGQPRLDGRSV